MKKIFLIIIVAILVFIVLRDRKTETVQVIQTNSFEECVAKNYTVQESYPRRCVTPEGKTFTENIGNRIEKQDLIIVENPLPNQTVSKPLTIKGRARGFWFFEASMPARILDQNKKPVFYFSIETSDEWMTEEFVNFEKVVDFGTSTIPQKGYLEIMKNNPSDLRENDDSLIIPISFSNSVTEIPAEAVQ